MENHTESNITPLFVDLDGTLIKTDMLYESFFRLLKSEPLKCLLIPFWLLRGKAHMKQMIAERIDFDASTIPYNKVFLEYLRNEAKKGRKLILATATNHLLANEIANHLGIFSETISSNDGKNLSGTKKLKEIQKLTDGSPYDYAGNAKIDLPIWEHARKAILVNPLRGVECAARKNADIEQVFNEKTGNPFIYLKAMRTYQWMKNLLIFVPILTAHKFSNASLVINELIAFAAFSFCASGVYILNDLLDLSADRQHPRKCKRPFASGDIELTHGIVLACLLPLVGLGIALLISQSFFYVLLIYLAMTTAYSVKFKAYAILDILLLASLYTIRIFAGAVAIDVELSFWLLSFSMFIFLSLALVKRCSELIMLIETKRTETSGRGYHINDLELLKMMGVASGYISILVIALYLDNPTITEQYTHPQLLWLLCPVLLLWVSRIWLKTGRSEVHDDPLVYAVQDRGSQIITITSILIVFAAI